MLPLNPVNKPLNEPSWRCTPPVLANDDRGCGSDDEEDDEDDDDEEDDDDDILPEAIAPRPPSLSRSSVAP